MLARKAGVAVFLALVMVLTMATASMAAGNVKIVVDGNTVSSDVAPVVDGGRTLVPLRVVSESFGAKVGWNGDTKTVTVDSAANDVKLTIGSKSSTVNGKNKTLDVSAQSVKGRTLVPLRFISEALGAKVNYDSASRTINVKYFSDMKGTLKIGGSTTIQPIAEAAADKLMKMNSGLSVTVAGTGSGDGVKGVGSGQYNIGNASRAIKDSEKAAYPDLVDFQIGSDAIAVAVHPSNPVSKLTKQQVFDIYTGKVKNWKEVGGNNAPIFVQTREEGSGTLGAFTELAIEEINEKATIVGTATPHPSNGQVKQTVSQDKNSIGFISLGYVDNTVKALKIEGVAATSSNALAGKYPYVRPLTVATKGQPTVLAGKFIDYYSSPEGKKIMKAENYLPME